MATEAERLVYILEARFGEAENAVNRMDRRFDRFADSTTRDMNRSERAVQGFAGSIRTILLPALGALAAGVSARAVIEYADSYNLLQGQLRAVTGDADRATGVFQSLLDVAQRTRAPVAANTALFSRLRGGLRDVADEEIIQFVERLNQTFVISGATAAEAANSTIQLSQGLASGALRGDELRSVLEGNVRFSRALAEGLTATAGVGEVTVGRLRELGAEGELTTERIFAALQAAGGTLQGEFDQLPTTVGQAVQQIQNALLVYIGESDSSLNATGRLAEALTGLANNFESVAGAAILLGGGGLAILASRGMGGLAAATGQATRSLIAKEQSARQLNTRLIQTRTATARTTAATLASRQAALTAAQAMVAQGESATILSVAQGRVAVATVAAERAAIRLAAAQQRATLASRALAVAGRAASGALAFFGGPIGLAITAASIGMLALANNADRARRRMEDITSEAESLRTELNLTTEAQEAFNEVMRLDRLDDMNDRVTRYTENLAIMRAQLMAAQGEHSNLTPEGAAATAEQPILDPNQVGLGPDQRAFMRRRQRELARRAGGNFTEAETARAAELETTINRLTTYVAAYEGALEAANNEQFRLLNGGSESGSSGGSSGDSGKSALAEEMNRRATALQGMTDAVERAKEEAQEAEEAFESAFSQAFGDNLERLRNPTEDFAAQLEMIRQGAQNGLFDEGEIVREVAVIRAVTAALEDLADSFDTPAEFLAALENMDFEGLLPEGFADDLSAVVQRVGSGIEDATDAASELGEAIGKSIGGAFEDAILQAESLGDILQSLAQDITRILFREFVTNPLSDFISTGISAITGGGGNAIGDAVAGSAAIQSSASQQTVVVMSSEIKISGGSDTERDMLRRELDQRDRQLEDRFRGLIVPTVRDGQRRRLIP